MKRCRGEQGKVEKRKADEWKLIGRPPTTDGRDKGALLNSIIILIF